MEQNHWTLYVSALIQSGVDTASDGLTPLLNGGSQFSVFSSHNNISTSQLVAAVASSEQHSSASRGDGVFGSSAVRAFDPMVPAWPLGADNTTDSPLRNGGVSSALSEWQ